ncbi:MAG: SUMF1/EgtB/PvdO family nonheme iron enzyme [Bacteroidales bacterium]|nr:SUMF1/EgtB/PvdO family nonheme iron enzyme [Bacteroidales bacterium]
MSERKKPKSITKAIVLSLAGGLVLGIVVMLFIGHTMAKTSSSDYCMSCHVHEQADADWKKSKHYNSSSGAVVDCAECHLPPKEESPMRYWMAKARSGAKDIWSKWTKDPESFDWESRRNLEYATGIVYNESCEKCHVNLFPEGITDDGITAHLHYEENAEAQDLQCISCHLDAGHIMQGYEHKSLKGKVVTTGTGVRYEKAAEVTSFTSFDETVPGTSACIRMIAVPGGEFLMGSPEDEPFRNGDEGPQKKVRISPFFMAEVEITWDQFWEFYNETMSEGRTPPAKIYANNSREDCDAVSGPTPPFGFPDQGWGMGERPAITMTYYSAQTFCQWLSLKTGRKYRLPTEAEWEYAARGGTSTPYFFEGNPKAYSNEGFIRKFKAADTTMIRRYVVYEGDSGSRTAEASAVKANPFGLKNMLGNVMEYCSDWYAEDAYSRIPDGAVDPKGPESGEEHVVRGGCYADDASKVRCASRSHTRNDAWLRTDPQNPKSIWWYSDIKGIGFRVVCEVPEGIGFSQ